jgi:integrase
VKFTRERYQSGCLTRESRKARPDVWIFRWRETRPDGRVNRKVIVGSVEQYQTKAAALKAVENLRVNINTESFTPLTVQQLVAHYTEIELPTKAFSTNQVYRVYLKTWVLPEWGHIRPSDVRTVAVEKWLRSLPLADGSKAKIRNIMSVLFNHAIRYEWVNRNPITHVRQSAKRQRIPEILEAEEMRNLMAELGQPFSTMVFLAAIGLRASEFLALKWKDANITGGEITLRRGVVQQVVGEMKTETSQKPLPMVGALAETLQDWKEHSNLHQS